MNRSVIFLGAVTAAIAMTSVAATEGFGPALVVRGLGVGTWPIEITTKPAGPAIVIYQDGQVGMRNCDRCELHDLAVKY